MTEKPKLLIQDMCVAASIIKLPNEYIGFSGALISKSNF